MAQPAGFIHPREFHTTKEFLQRHAAQALEPVLREHEELSFVNHHDGILLTHENGFLHGKHIEAARSALKEYFERLHQKS